MNDDRTTHETDPIAAQLDAMGARERSQPDGAFERRIVDSAMRALDETAPAPIPIETRRVWFRPVAAMAASLLVVGAGALAWIGSRPSPNQGLPDESSTQLAAFEQDVDDLLALSDLIDEHAGLWVDELRTDADLLGDSIGQTWDALGVDLAEESI